MKRMVDSFTNTTIAARRSRRGRPFFCKRRKLLTNYRQYREGSALCQIDWDRDAIAVTVTAPFGSVGSVGSVLR